MSNTELLGLYVGGCILSLIFTLTGTGDRIYADSSSSTFKKVIFGLISIFCWPIILPLSFLVLWTSLCFFGLVAGLLILKWIKCEVTVLGTTPSLALAKMFPTDLKAVPAKE